MKRRSHRADEAERKLSGGRLRRRYLVSQGFLGVIATFFALATYGGLTENYSPARRSTAQASSGHHQTSGVIFSSVILAALIWIMVRRHLDVSRRYRDGDPILCTEEAARKARRARGRRSVVHRVMLYAVGVGVVVWGTVGIVSTVQENERPTYWGTFRAYHEVCGGHRTSPSICHSYGTFDSDNGEFRFLRVELDDRNVAPGETARAVYVPHVLLSDAYRVTSSGPTWWHLLAPGLLELLAVTALLVALVSDAARIRARVLTRHRR